MLESESCIILLQALLDTTAKLAAENYVTIIVYFSARGDGHASLMSPSAQPRKIAELISLDEFKITAGKITEYIVLRASLLL